MAILLRHIRLNKMNRYLMYDRNVVCFPFITIAGICDRISLYRYILITKNTKGTFYFIENLLMLKECQTRSLAAKKISAYKLIILYR